MSLSPASTNSEHGGLKRRRPDEYIESDPYHVPPPPQQHSSAQSINNLEIRGRRGARACTNCRRGKNRCEGEKPEKKAPQPNAGPSMERLSRLEGQYLVMQSQMIGMQSSLDRILSLMQGQAQNQQMFSTVREGSFGGSAPVPSSRHGTNEGYGSPSAERPRFPPLPGFAAPPHKYGTYGIVPSTAPSSDDESEDTLPRSALNAPIEALQGLANAAAEAAAVPSTSPPRVRKRKKAEPIPRNAFPHVVEKVGAAGKMRPDGYLTNHNFRHQGLVSDPEARELFHIFFSGCHLFIPLFDPAYDTYEGVMDRSPWTFDAILAIAAKIRSGNAPLGATFYKCLEEAQGIARSSLFGPIVRKEAVMGMLLLAAWSTNGWLPSGHAMRMALDLGLHRALEKLAETDSVKKRDDEEERDLVVSARIWLCLYWIDHQMSLGTGRPIVLRDEFSIKHCRLLLTHPMASPTDVRLISQVELIAQKTQIYETLSPLNGQVNHNTLAFIRRANVALDKWWQDCDDLHRQTSDEESLFRKMLAADLHYAKLWLVCVALRGVSWDKMPFEQRELAFQAKDAASNCLSIILNSAEYRAALRYAVHDALVMAAFSGLFLLKMANLFPSELDLSGIMSQVEQLAQLLSDVAAERYALTLRIMLANLKRKIGLNGAAATVSGTTSGGVQLTADGVAAASYVANAFVGQTPAGALPFTMEELGFPALPPDRGVFSSSTIPAWLQEQVRQLVSASTADAPAFAAAAGGQNHKYQHLHYATCQGLTDLGIPINGSDGIFLQMTGTNGWVGDFAPMPEAW